MPTNTERQRRALDALQEYLEENDQEAALRDLLADLHHLFGADEFDSAQVMARVHYEEEKQLDPEESTA